MSDAEQLLDRIVCSLPGGGEPRTGQREMTVRVARAIGQSRHLVVRAGTGTGKSLAYLAAAVASNKRVLVATATKALQHQLVDKDLPTVAAASRRRVRYALLKGRSNYLCAQRLSEAGMRGAQEAFDSDAHALAPRARAEMAAAIGSWAASTATGDAAELSFEPDPVVWRSYSVTADECPGAGRCAFGEVCFAERARAAAAEADIVIVNLHLLGAHLSSGGVVLPPFDVAIIDEAHEAEEIFSRSLGVSVAPGRLRAVAQMARSATGRRSSSVDEAAAALADSASELEALCSERTGQRLRPADDERCARVIELAGSRAETLERRVRSGSEGGEMTPQALRSLQSLSSLRRDLASFAEIGSNHVAWVSSGNRPAFELAPLDLASALADSLFSDGPVIFTSATVLGDEAVRLGADPGRTDVFDAGSPFDYEQQALLYCAAHLPDRRDGRAEAAIVEEIVALLAAAGGRALVLFTSWGAMRRVAEAVRGRTALPILVQGERSNAALTEALGNVAELSVFATMGFWQGVDVPGPSLSLVVIDRLPFARPDDPLNEARRERAGANAFVAVDLPRVKNLLAQGAGRLVRTASDRGVVAVLDSRLATASYRWELVRALPPMRRTKDRSVAEAFLRAIDAAERGALDAPSPR